jgi:hypothetical protein
MAKIVEGDPGDSRLGGVALDEVHQILRVQGPAELGGEDEVPAFVVGSPQSADLVLLGAPAPQGRDGPGVDGDGFVGIGCLAAPCCASSIAARWASAASALAKGRVGLRTPTCPRSTEVQDCVGCRHSHDDDQRRLQR